VITNAASGTNLHEIAPGIYRINTPAPIPGGEPFNFNQYLVADDEPLLFHTGPRAMFPLVAEAVGKVVPLDRLRHVAFSHVEADECGALNDFLAAAPRATAACSRVAAMVSVNDMALRPPRALADGEVLRTGRHAFQWIDAPHVPHGWDCGFLMERETRTLLCGDLFTQGGAGAVAVTEAGDRLLRARPADRGHPRAPGPGAAAGARLHARQRLARRWRGAPARAGRVAGFAAGSGPRGVTPRRLW